MIRPFKHDLRHSLRILHGHNDRRGAFERFLRMVSMTRCSHVIAYLQRAPSEAVVVRGANTAQRSVKGNSISVGPSQQQKVPALIYRAGSIYTFWDTTARTPLESMKDFDHDCQGDLALKHVEQRRNHLPFFFSGATVGVNCSQEALHRSVDRSVVLQVSKPTVFVAPPAMKHSAIPKAVQFIRSKRAVLVDAWRRKRIIVWKGLHRASLSMSVPSKKLMLRFPRWPCLYKSTWQRAVGPTL